MNKLILIFVVFLISLSSVSAFIIEHHSVINNEAISKTLSSPITQTILKNKDYFNACDVLADFSIVDYFSEGLNSVGRQYTATHSPSSCLRAVSIAKTDKELTCAYGLCAHQVQDVVSHNEYVNLVIKKTHLQNGLIHSIGEIRIKDKYTASSDAVLIRNILSIGYEMTPFLNEVFAPDPSFSKVNVPAEIDFFITQVTATNDYKLGFKAFFALPSYIYTSIGIIFMISLISIALIFKKMKFGRSNSGTKILLV
ncbi:MAG: hypothetical protein AABY22_17785, partial [Nanoarchaeota archaeon]